MPQLVFARLRVIYTAVQNAPESWRTRARPTESTGSASYEHSPAGGIVALHPGELQRAGRAPRGSGSVQIDDLRRVLREGRDIRHRHLQRRTRCCRRRTHCCEHHRGAVLPVGASAGSFTTRMAPRSAATTPSPYCSPAASWPSALSRTYLPNAFMRTRHGSVAMIMMAPKQQGCAAVGLGSRDLLLR